ncbi:hypothetical protein GCM10011611_32600 [Aliidongia dinghuensis]|uniref:GDP-mannose pyrophosphatase n=1 Tax=Aliidongia dinghuensis TaxID=1867774 RepID=A0A8J2YV37_9PROT|nr:NUDIX hydrolase [Aliidongia dinghuensis]GGF23987.1 hypothetical protein GCM10011611_32600 [Aliidongia dinghuensis]
MAQGRERFRSAFSTPWFVIEESVGADPASQPYYRLAGPDGAICLPLTRTGEIVLVRQFRPAIGQMTLEIPAGSIDPGETPEAAALREVMEETGYRCRRIHRLGRGRLLPNRCSWSEYFFLGLGAESDGPAESGAETLVMDRAAFRQLLADGQIEQSAVFCLLGMATMGLSVDLLTDPVEVIYRAVDGAGAEV